MPPEIPNSEQAPELRAPALMQVVIIHFDKCL